jgi:hypothetical protein
MAPATGMQSAADEIDEGTGTMHRSDIWTIAGGLEHEMLSRFSLYCRKLVIFLETLTVIWIQLVIGVA